MRKIFLMLLMQFMALAIWSQDNEDRFAIAFRAGINFQKLTGNDATGIDLDYDIRTGYHGGFFADIPVATNTFLQPGVLYSAKGVEFDHDHELHVNYIEIPINLVYKPQVGMARMLFGAGPYLGIGISGKNKLGGSSSTMKFDVEFENKRPADATDPNIIYIRKYDAGFNFLTGLEFSGNFFVLVNAQLGLQDLYPEQPDAPDDQTDWRNRGFGVSVGYRFMRKG